MSGRFHAGERLVGLDIHVLTATLDKPRQNLLHVGHGKGAYPPCRERENVPP